MNTNNETRNITNEELQEYQKQLEEGMLQTISSGKWNEILDFLSKVYNYSWNNAFMAMYQAKIKGIEIQGIFRGAKQWEEEFNRKVKDSEKDRALQMLAPKISKYSKKPKFDPKELVKGDTVVIKGRIIKKIFEKDNYGIFSIQVEEINGKHHSGYINIKGNINGNVKLYSYYEIEGKVALYKNGRYWERQIEVKTVEEISYISSYTSSTLNGFLLVDVYDINQTEGEELPIETYCSELKGNSENAAMVYNTLCNILDIPVVEEKITKGNGYFDPSPNKLKIGIKESLGEIHKTKTLIHETAHYKIHLQKENGLKLSKYADGKGDRKSLYAIEEVIVESVAYIVAKHFGFDTGSYSFEYVTGWGEGDPTCIKKVGSIIQQTAKEIIESINGYLKENTEIAVA